MKFIKFPNGDVVRCDAIYAIKKGDAGVGGHIVVPYLKDRVIVQFYAHQGGGGIPTNNFISTSTVMEFESPEARDIVAADLLDQVEKAQGPRPQDAELIERYETALRRIEANFKGDVAQAIAAIALGKR
jgi:hypothetical protein